MSKRNDKKLERKTNKSLDFFLKYFNGFFLFQAIPEARIVWKYKDTYVNNGSTLLSDIDMRHYYYIERDIGSGTLSRNEIDIDSTHKKSELFLAATR